MMGFFLEAGGWTAKDVVRLYNNIDIPDLLASLDRILEWAWQAAVPLARSRAHSYDQPLLHADIVVQVFKKKSFQPSWYVNIRQVRKKYRHVDHNTGAPDLMINDNMGKDKHFDSFFVFSLDDAKSMAKLLVENSYVEFGPLLYKQHRGIPMGINPAVFMANMYLTSYEYAFEMQCADIIEQYSPRGGYC